MARSALLPQLLARLLAAALVASLGCGAGGARVEDGVLHKGHVTVRMGAVPPAWSSVSVDGADVAWRDDAAQASVLLDVRCHERDGDAPLGSLTAHLIMGTTERNVVTQDTLPFDGREAQHTVMTAKLDGVALQYDLYVMKKDGCVYDLVYVAPPDRFTQGAPEFERFATGMHASSGS